MKYEQEHKESCGAVMMMMVIVFLIAACTAMSGCETVKGFGRDLQKISEPYTDSAGGDYSQK